MFSLLNISLQCCFGIKTGFLECYFHRKVSGFKHFKDCIYASFLATFRTAFFTTFRTTFFASSRTAFL